MAHKIFISHAHKDKPVADRFVELLILGCGLSGKDIIYTSEMATGIPAGTNFINYLVDNLRNSPIVILLLSRNFYNSTFCLSELGATWGLDKPIFPIIIPDLSINEMQDVLQVMQKGYITDKEYLDTLRDVIAHTHKDTMPPTSQWNSKCEQFLRDVSNLIAALPKSSKIDSSVYEALANEHTKAIGQLKDKEAETSDLKKSVEELNAIVKVSMVDESAYQVLEGRLVASIKQLELKNAEIDQLKQSIQQLKTVKDGFETKEIVLSDSSDLEKFQELVLNVANSFEQLPKLVGKAIYTDYLNEGLYLDSHHDIEEARTLVRSGYLTVGYQYDIFNLAKKRRSVNIALVTLSLLQEFLEEVELEDEFGQWVYHEYDFEPNELLRNEDFWIKHLYSTHNRRGMGNIEDIPF